MYGDERHISVLRSEIESNDVEYQSESGWSFHDSVLKNYQPRTKSVLSSTTTTTTTTTPESSTRSTTQEPATESGEANSNVTEDPFTLSSSELYTTELNTDTTLEYEATTINAESEKPQTVHKHELFEKSQTTEETQMYKLRGV